MASHQFLLLDLLLFTGLAALALGHLLAGRDHRLPLKGQVKRCLVLPRRTGHLVSGVGYLAFGLFWVGQVGHFRELNDPVNALFAAAALPFFGYLAYHEYQSYQWNEVYTPLRWLGATAVIAGGIYFAVDRVPLLSGALVQVVADQSAWVLTNLFGYPSSTGPLDFGTDQLWFRAGSGGESVRLELLASEKTAPLDIYIVLACTALQSMIIFVGGILATKAPNNRRLKAFLITVPVIYVLNLFRNAIITYLAYTETTSFDFAHTIVGKGGSLIALVLIAVATFTVLPELHENILGLFDLPKRRRGSPPTANLESSEGPGPGEAPTV